MSAASSAWISTHLVIQVLGPNVLAMTRLRKPATGFAARKGEPNKPKVSPVFYLGDPITGDFAAAGMMAALLRRSIEGGSYHVKVSLARSVDVGTEAGLT